MIILYLILLNYDNVPADALIQDVEKSLEILRSMGTVHVAHRCSQLISEVLEIAKAQIARRRQEAGAAPRPSASQSSAAAAASVNENLQPATGGNYQPELNSHETTAGVFGEEVLTSLIDFNLLGDFAGLGDMRAFFNSTNGAGSGPGQGIEGDLSSFGAQNDLHGGEDGVLFDISSDMELGLFGSLQGFVT
jgi:hypothetical protein